MMFYDVHQCASCAANFLRLAIWLIGGQPTFLKMFCKTVPVIDVYQGEDISAFGFGYSLAQLTWDFIPQLLLFDHYVQANALLWMGIKLFQDHLQEAVSSTFKLYQAPSSGRIKPLQAPSSRINHLQEAVSSTLKWIKASGQITTSSFFLWLNFQQRLRQRFKSCKPTRGVASYGRIHTCSRWSERKPEGTRIKLDKSRSQQWAIA